jgi:hypothetical protein
MKNLDSPNSLFTNYEKMAISIFSIFTIFLLIFMINPTSHQPSLSVEKNSLLADFCMDSTKDVNFEHFLLSNDFPTEILVNGELLKANEKLAALDCILVYGDFNDFNPRVQQYNNYEWKYVGYSQDGQLIVNPYFIDLN